MEIVVELPASRFLEPEGLLGSESLWSVAIEPSGSDPSLPLSTDISPWSESSSSSELAAAFPFPFPLTSSSSSYSETSVSATSEGGPEGLRRGYRGDHQFVLVANQSLSPVTLDCCSGSESVAEAETSSSERTGALSRWR